MNACHGSTDGQHHWSGYVGMDILAEKVTKEPPEVYAEARFKTCMHCGRRELQIYIEDAKEWSAWTVMP